MTASWWTWEGQRELGHARVEWSYHHPWLGLSPLLILVVFYVVVYWWENR